MTFVQPSIGNVKSNGKTIELQFLGDFTNAVVKFGHTINITFIRNSVLHQVIAEFTSIITADTDSLLVWYSIRPPSNYILENDTDLLLDMPRGAIGNDTLFTDVVIDFSIDNFSSLTVSPLRSKIPNKPVLPTSPSLGV